MPGSISEIRIVLLLGHRSSELVKTNAREPITDVPTTRIVPVLTVTDVSFGSVGRNCVTSASQNPSPIIASASHTRLSVETLRLGVAPSFPQLVPQQRVESLSFPTSLLPKRSALGESCYALAYWRL